MVDIAVLDNNWDVHMIEEVKLSQSKEINDILNEHDLQHEYSFPVKAVIVNPNSRTYDIIYLD